MDPESNLPSGPEDSDPLTFEALYDELHALAHRQIRRFFPVRG